MTRHSAQSVEEYLGSLTIDWADFERAAEVSRECLERVSGDPQALTRLLVTAINSPPLRAKAETHQLLDYFVIYDALDRGFRLRLHVSTSDHLQRPHDHRFDFSTRILCGSYEHCIIQCSKDPYSMSNEVDALPFQDRAHPDPRALLRNEDFPVAKVEDQRSGDTLSLHHSVVHTVLTTAGTVSLVLRGPARRRRSFIFDRGDQSLWWRFGQQDEISARREAKIMSDAKVASALGDLRALGIINGKGTP